MPQPLDCAVSHLRGKTPFDAEVAEPATASRVGRAHGLACECRVLETPLDRADDQGFAQTLAERLRLVERGALILSFPVLRQAILAGEKLGRRHRDIAWSGGGHFMVI